MAPFKLRFSKSSKSRSKDGNRSQPETPRTEYNQVAVGNNLQSRFPHSPPPSYERVLQETRLKKSTSDSAEGTAENESENREGTTPITLIQSSERSREIVKGPEIIHKSSKELYRAVAKQWGITCKMSDHCRCFDCQSCYFDCGYEKEGQGTTSDGGLSAGAPMFIAEVMHGTACILL